MTDRYSDLSCTFEVKSEGDNVARFTGIASTSDLDQQHDIIEAGAFDPIPMKMGPDGQNIPDVMLLRDHDRSEIVGGWRSFRTEGRQLKVEGELCLEVAKARETHTLMKRGYLSGLSVGFSIKSMKDIDYDQNTGKRTIKKALLRECSIVGFPANTRARVLNVKSLFDELFTGADSSDQFLERFEKMEARLLSALQRKVESEHRPPPEDDEVTKALKRARNLIQGIDGHEPIDEPMVKGLLSGLLTQVKGYRHV